MIGMGANDITKVKQMTEPLVSISDGKKELFVKTINAFRSSWTAQYGTGISLENIRISDVDKLAAITDRELKELLTKCPAYDENNDKFLRAWNAMKEKAGDVLAPLESINKDRKGKGLNQISQWEYIRIILSDQIGKAENREESKSPADASKIIGDFREKSFLV